jgi:hypothetical protein
MLGRVLSLALTFLLLQPVNSSAQSAGMRYLAHAEPQSNGAAGQEPTAATPELASKQQGQDVARPDPTTVAPGTAATPNAAAVPAAAALQQPQPITVPTGTRLPLILRNGINTRTAKSGDSIYFETIYPIAVNNRIVIPMGTFLRGQLVDSKRPGFVKGRGEIRMTLEQMTLPNGYTVSLTATPSSADRDGQEGVDNEGTIKGPSGKARDVALLLVATAGGAYIGSLAGGVINNAPGKGALIGSGAGATAAIVAILATRGPEAELPRGTTLDVVFNRPLLLDPALLPVNDPGHVSASLPPAPEPRQSSRRDDARRRIPLGSLPSLLRF